MMLGVNTKRTLISGKYADDIRSRVNRIRNKALNDQDREEIRKHKQAMQKVTIVWK